MVTVEQKLDANATALAANKDILTQILAIVENPAAPSVVAEAIAPLTAAVADLHTKADAIIASQAAEAAVLGTDTTTGGNDTTTGAAAGDTLTGGEDTVAGDKAGA